MARQIAYRGFMLTVEADRLDAFMWAATVYLSAAVKQKLKRLHSKSAGRPSGQVTWHGNKGLDKAQAANLGQFDALGRLSMGNHCFGVFPDVFRLIDALAFIEGTLGVTTMAYLSTGPGEPTLPPCLKSSLLATQPTTPTHGSRRSEGCGKARWRSLPLR
jgi:hypothetical protein